MPTSTVTSQGQTTLPHAVRQTLGLEAGDKVDFVAVEDGYKLVARRKDIRALTGRLSDRVDTPVSIEEMDEAIADAATEGRR